MIRTGKSTELAFDPPGPGSWEQDPVHFPRPMTRYFRETHPPALKRGTHDFAHFYGLLIDGLQIGYGEIALIDGGPRSATVTAATDLVCYGLTFWEFRPLVEGNGAIGWKLLQALARRLRAADLR